MAALGGMIVPAVIFVAFNAGGTVLAGGGSRWRPTSPSRSVWSRSSAAGCRRSVKVFLLTLAIVDDIGAIVVIAVFYTDALEPGLLLVALGARGARRA